MIIFNGIALESVADVKIDDIRVSPIPLNPVARERAIRFGSEFVRMGGGQRTVSITFALLDMDRISRNDSIRAITSWAKNDAEYKLQLPTDPGRYLTGVCTARPEPSTRQWWESKLRLVFTCYENPYWTDEQEKTVSCGTAFTVLGDAPPLMRIENTFESAVSNHAYSNGEQTITFSTIPAGDMVIDLNNQTAVVGSSSIMQYYQLSSGFIIPKTGTQTITGTGSIKYRERWE